jgi:hypothetical protein
MDNSKFITFKYKNKNNFLPEGPTHVARDLSGITQHTLLCRDREQLSREGAIAGDRDGPIKTMHRKQCIEMCQQNV